MCFRYFYSVIDNLNNLLFPEKLREDYPLFYFPLSPCGERAIKLEFLDPCSKFVVHKNLFILHNDSETEGALRAGDETECQSGKYLVQGYQLVNGRLRFEPGSLATHPSFLALPTLGVFLSNSRNIPKLTNSHSRPFLPYRLHVGTTQN